VLLNLEHLSRRLPDLRTGRDYLAEARVRLNEAHDGAERVAAVVRQMRMFSRMRRVEKSGPVSVPAVLDGALQLVGNEIRHRGQLVTAIRDVPSVVGREGQMEQAFLTLLIFAARLLPEESEQRGQMAIATTLDEQGRVEVTVRCVGAPLHAAARQRIFEPFGSGGDEPALGLAMCADIVQSMKGGIFVDGDDTETVFRVVLPPAAETTSEQLSETPHPERPSPLAPGARARVLVIDDDPGVSSGLRLMLQDSHDVTSVGSGREALELLLGAQDFDVVFCDFVMPDMSGEDVYYALKLNRPGTEGRLVFMTGAVFSPDAERFLGQIDNPRLEKPFHLPRVEELLSAAVRDGRT
jgi:CheY-like chemotaxis protein